MALPSSGPLGINAIRTELGQAQGNNSLSLLSNQVGFLAPNAISEFYGYSAATMIFLVEPGTPSQGEVCGIDGGEFPVYFAGTGCPVVGQTLYTDAGLTNRFDGQNLWWKSYQCNCGYYIMSNGFVEGYTPC